MFVPLHHNLCNFSMKHLFILALTALLFGACAQNKTTSMNEQSITMTQEWDKTFPLSEKVNYSSFASQK